MKKYILGIVTITLLMFVGTNDSVAQNTAKEKLTYEQQKENHRQSKHRSYLDIWQERLDLTAEQITAVTPAYQEYVTAVRTLKANTDLDDSEKKTTAIALREAYDLEFKKHLTEVQKEKLDQYGNNKNVRFKSKK